MQRLVSIYLILAIFTLISVCASLGYAIEACVKTQQKNAYYALARSLSIFIITIVTLIYHYNAMLITMSLLMSFTQFFDGLIGWKFREPFKTIGPLITALIQLILLMLFIF